MFLPPLSYFPHWITEWLKALLTSLLTSPPAFFSFTTCSHASLAHSSPSSPPRFFSLLLHLFYFHSLPSSILVTLSSADFCTPLPHTLLPAPYSTHPLIRLWYFPLTPSNDAPRLHRFPFSFLYLLYFLLQPSLPPSHLLFSLSLPPSFCTLPSFLQYISQCLSPSFHSLWAMALLILSVMILPKDNCRAENLLNLPECPCVHACPCVCVCETRGQLTFWSNH